MLSPEKYQDVEFEDTSYEGVIEKPFDPKRIDITTKQMILEAILKRLRNDEIDLNTFFQRNPNLWDNTKQSRLIESILIRLPLPAFYFDGSDDNNWLVVDGLQRLSTFKNYIIDETLTLQNLEYLTQFNGYTFDKLPRDLQRRIEEHEITVYIINPGTPDEVKFNLFRRINTGGLILTAQEIRQALNQGVPANFITDLSESKEFKRYKINPKRMLDKDFVTRFLAFYLFSSNEYKPDLDDFLNKAMISLIEKTSEEREKIEKDFILAMNRAEKLFNKYAFRKRYKNKDKLKPKNKALFEVWSVILSKLESETYSILLNKKYLLNKNLIELLKNNKDFEKSITTSTGDPKNVKKRFKYINQIINLTIEDKEYDCTGDKHTNF